MFDDSAQMMPSRRLVESQFRPRHPELAQQFVTRPAILARSLAIRAFQRRQYSMAVQLLAGYPDPSPWWVWKSAGWLLRGLSGQTAYGE